jgi:hypothetical protein
MDSRVDERGSSWSMVITIFGIANSDTPCIPSQTEVAYV